MGIAAAAYSEGGEKFERINAAALHSILKEARGLNKKKCGMFRALH